MRKCREYAESELYHAINRGNDKQDIFYDANDRIKFLSILKKYKDKYQIEIFGYVLMSNHIHLVLKAPDKSISSYMQIVSSIYAKYFNRKYDRIGHLFQGRFLSETINNDKEFISVFQYVVKNPEKAGIAKFDEYKWSCYNELKKNTTWINKKKILEIFGSETKLFSFLHKNNPDTWLEPSLRQSEKQQLEINEICNLLNSKSPIINPELSFDEIKEKIQLIKQNGYSINSIARITRVSKRNIKLCLESKP